MVAAVENDTKALERLKLEAFNPTLLDIMMPIMSGYTTLENL